VTGQGAGLVELVPLTEILAAITGDNMMATHLAVQILSDGVNALPRGRDDLHAFARSELIRTGVVRESGQINQGRAAELVAVCEVVATVAKPTATSVLESRLVLSAPTGSIDLTDFERLDGFIIDVIRRSISDLVLGGPFWNEAGFVMLDEVLLPAIESRGVAVTIYVNPPDPPYRDVLESRLASLRSAGRVSVRWFVGPRPTMLHAKFVIRDGIHGYLGTANLTSWGMAGHVEAGVELTPNQCTRFVRFLGQLEMANLFSDTPGT
jgi:hypothetical protein